MATVKREDLRKMIDDSKGLFFTIVFVKADNTERRMTARKGVKKGLKGEWATKQLITKYMDVYDVFAGGYRTINLETAKTIKMRGVTYEII